MSLKKQGVFRHFQGEKLPNRHLCLGARCVSRFFPAFFTLLGKNYPPGLMCARCGMVQRSNRHRGPAENACFSRHFVKRGWPPLSDLHTQRVKGLSSFYLVHLRPRRATRFRGNNALLKDRPQVPDRGARQQRSGSLSQTPRRQRGETTGLPRSLPVALWVRPRLFAGGAPSAPDD
jgi:hypothetical protein